MNVYVWNRVGHLTSNWHRGGGLVVVAEEPPTTWHVPAEWDPADEYTGELPPPDFTYPTDANAEPRVFVFPDAGCC